MGLNGQTLLEKAKAIPVVGSKRPPADRQRVELAVAWFCGEITHEQARGALECSAQNVASNCATALKRGVATGVVRIEMIAR